MVGMDPLYVDVEIILRDVSVTANITNHFVRLAWYLLLVGRIRNTRNSTDQIRNTRDSTDHGRNIMDSTAQCKNSRDRTKIPVT